VTLVAGVDSSTQSTKVLVCDARTGAVVRQSAAPHPEGTEVHPDGWLQALRAATADGLLDGVAAIAVGGQQHGMVVLDEQRRVLRPALLWNDVRSAPAARALTAELGGPAAWAQAVGLVPVASFTVTKLRWLAEHEPEVAARACSVLLPHDWLTLQLRGCELPLTTDRGDASGTGYWSPADEDYRMDLLVRAFGRELEVPVVLAPDEPAGETLQGALVAAGTGDNMAAALGLGAGPGDVVVSLGTSGTVFAVHPHPVADQSGAVAGFADAQGGYLPLVATMNAARVLTATAQLLGTDAVGLDALALQADPGSGGLVLLPYLDGERTPDLPDATGRLLGLTRASMTPSNLARAAYEGMLCGLADAVDALVRQGVEPRRVVLIGGAARSAAVCAIAPSLLGLPVVVPEPGEYVARGAARQAAWTLAGGQPPEWDLPVTTTATGDAEVGRRVRAAFAESRDEVLAASR
jgi:xylulokinase